MKIKRVRLSNFRSYKDEVTIEFSDLNVFVGKNDIGKSTVLEALDIFFHDGKGVVKIDKDDINKKSLNEDNTEIKIAITFDDLPESLTIDTTNPTVLANEFLLNRDGCLEIIKKYPNAGKEKIYLKAYHPTNPACADLLLKKNSDLKKILQAGMVCADKTKNAEIRRAIWNFYTTDLQLDDIEIDLAKEDAKNIWDQLKNYLPLYSLFQSDRKNSDEDSEVQNPMKLAVQEILRDEEIRSSLNDVAQKVETKLHEVATKTLEKLNEMNPEIADTLTPIIPSAESLKWTDVFKNVSIAGDDNIPINKRGSGIKRLILLNFFRAEAERRQRERDIPSVIYAIEEPETAQHPSHQRKLIEAFIELSKADNTQIILTTHSPSIVKLLEFEHLRLIKDDTCKEIIHIERGSLPYPSLNEVSHSAFGESTEEYHNELYGYIESEQSLNDFKIGRQTVQYVKINRKNTTKIENIILSEYIRHQIHHPENSLNQRYTNEQLQQSINEMRIFISQLST